MSTLFLKFFVKFRNYGKSAAENDGCGFFLVKYAKRGKIQLVGRNQAVLNPLPLAFHGKSVTCAVKVTVKTADDLILFKQAYNLRTFIAFIPGWIM